MRSLMLQAKALDLSSCLKHHRLSPSSKSKPNHSKKPKPNPVNGTPVVIRRSLRTHGISPPPSPAEPLAVPPSPPVDTSVPITAVGSCSFSDELRSGVGEKEAPFQNPSSLSQRAQMAPGPETLTDYERRRLDNIRRNVEMMRSFKLHEKASALSSGLKRRCHRKPKPKPGDGTPIVVRRSLRTRGISAPSPTAELPALPSIPPKQGPFLMRDALRCGPRDSDSSLITAILGSRSFVDKPRPGSVKEVGTFDPRSELVRRPNSWVKVGSEKIMSVRFMPLIDRAVVVVGDKVGHLGFWDVNFSEGNEKGVYTYSPHSDMVSGISVNPFSPTKIFTSSYDGFVRLMNVEKEMFNMLFSSENCFYSISQQPQDCNLVYVGEGLGTVKVWDERTGGDAFSWDLHRSRINTIDFNPENVNLMATSTSGGLACLWDLRNMEGCIKRVVRETAVHSAYFSPSGNCLAIKSFDNAVGILGGLNFDDLSEVYRNTGTSRCSAIWGWDDSYLYISNRNKSIDILSTTDKSITELGSHHLTSIPYLLAAHPYMIGHLAGAGDAGGVCLWTKGCEAASVAR